MLCTQSTSEFEDWFYLFSVLFVLLCFVFGFYRIGSTDAAYAEI